jgi:hypothetical protein
VKKEIFSWFNVIGLGEDADFGLQQHLSFGGGADPALLGAVASIGTQRGSYEIVTNSEMTARDLSKVENIFAKSLEKENRVQGMPYTLPDNTQVYLEVEEIKKGQVKLVKKGVCVEAKKINHIIQQVQMD